MLRQTAGSTASVARLERSVGNRSTLSVLADLAPTPRPARRSPLVDPWIQREIEVKVQTEKGYEMTAGYVVYAEQDVNDDIRAEAGDVAAGKKRIVIEQFYNNTDPASPKYGSYVPTYFKRKLKGVGSKVAHALATYAESKGYTHIYVAGAVQSAWSTYTDGFGFTQSRHNDETFFTTVAALKQRTTGKEIAYVPE